jgi:hypothetical protein
MKYSLLLILFLSLISCGKRSSSDDISVTTTPAIVIDEESATHIDSNTHFKVSANKAQYDVDELIMLEIQNLGSTLLRYNQFEFTSQTDELIVSKINCFNDLRYGEKCNFIIRFKSPRAGYHNLKVTYQGMFLVVTIELKGQTQHEPVDFLHKFHHTYADCYSAEKLGRNGFVRLLQSTALCQFRGPHWNSDDKTQVTTDPLAALKDPKIDANAFYCPNNWTVHSFEFESSFVTEHTNFFGGRKEVEIKSGEVKEICVARNLLGCKEKKTFYSRLVKVNCY